MVYWWWKGGAPLQHPQHEFIIPPLNFCTCSLPFPSAFSLFWLIFLIFPIHHVGKEIEKLIYILLHPFLFYKIEFKYTWFIPFYAIIYCRCFASTLLGASFSSASLQLKFCSFEETQEVRVDVRIPQPPREKVTTWNFLVLYFDVNKKHASHF